MCENLDGANAPFCSPTQNSKIQTGQDIEVTWDPDFFTNTSITKVQVQADFFSTTTGSDDDNDGGTGGFTSVFLSADSGRFTWSVLEEYLSRSTSNTTSNIEDGATSVTISARLFLAHRQQRLLSPPPPPSSGTRLGQQQQQQTQASSPKSSTQTVRIPGPVVQIIPSTLTPPMTATASPLSIALPVTFGVLLALAAITTTYMMFLRRKKNPLFSSVRKRLLPSFFIFRGGTNKPPSSSSSSATPSSTKNGYHYYGAAGQSRGQRLGLDPGPAGGGGGFRSSSSSGGGGTGGGGGGDGGGDGETAARSNINIAHSTFNAAGGGRGAGLRMETMSSRDPSRGQAYRAPAENLNNANVFREELRRQDSDRDSLKF